MQDILQLLQDLAYIIIGECFRTAWIYLLKLAVSWFFCHPENWLFTNQTFSLVTFQEQLCPWFTNSFNFLSKTGFGDFITLSIIPEYNLSYALPSARVSNFLYTKFNTFTVQCPAHGSRHAELSPQVRVQ